MRFKTVTTSDRKLNLNWDLVNTYVSKWKPGTSLTVEIKRKKNTNSDPLRQYYFAIVLPTFMNHLGYEPDEKDIFHRQLKIVYFSVKPDSKGIYRERDIPSVFSYESELAVSEKKAFMDWVVRKAAIEGAYIPDPE